MNNINDYCQKFKNKLFINNNLNDDNNNNNNNNNITMISITQFINAAIQNDAKMINFYHQTLNIPVDVVDKNGYTALIYASRNGNVNVVKRLIELQANVDYQEPITFSTALHYAAQCGHTRTAEVLINIGHANRLIQNQSGKTPYELAKDFGHGNNKIMKSLFDDDNLQSIISSSSSSSSSSISSSSLLSPLLKAKSMMGSSSSIDSGLSHDHNMMMKTNEYDLNNNNNQIINKNDDIYNKIELLKYNNNKKKITKKNVSYLPHSILLERFSRYGCYRLMGDGYGFSIIAKNGPTHQMIYEAFINLSIQLNDLDGLILTLEKIIQEFDTNIKLTVKEYEDFDPEHPDHQRINNLFAYNLWRKENNDKIIKMIQFLQQWKQTMEENAKNY